MAEPAEKIDYSGVPESSITKEDYNLLYRVIKLGYRPLVHIFGNKIPPTKILSGIQELRAGDVGDRVDVILGDFGYSGVPTSNQIDIIPITKVYRRIPPPP